jgi:hypothetical protein
MYNIGDIAAYQPRWQCMAMVLVTVRETRGGLTKAEAIEHIRNNRWFALEPEDKYPFNQHTSHEPRWITAIAWARKDCVKRDLMIKGSFNSWEISREGLNTSAHISKAFHDGTLDVRPCYLWSRHFKLCMNPAYIPGQTEGKRPIGLYDDWFGRLFGI